MRHRRRPTPPRAGHPRLPCRARPPLALILPRRHRGLIFPFSPQTLAPNPHCCRSPSSAGRRDSSPPVSRGSIPRGGSFLYLLSLDSTPNPAPSASLQGRRRSSPPAAAPARRTAPSPPLLACATAGEARRLLLIPVRAAPGPLRPRSAAPPSAGAAACARRARGRAQARGQGSPWP